MVFLAETLPRERRMATGKPHPLHNFNLPVLKWGTQRMLRCMKQNPNGEISGRTPARIWPPSDVGSAGFNSQNLAGVQNPPTSSPLEKLLNPPPPRPPRPPAESSDERIEQVRARLVGHLLTAADQMQYKVPELREEAETLPPWNLRTRRSVLKAPAAAESGIDGGSAAAVAAENSMRWRSKRLAPADEPIKEKEKTKLSVALSRKEIEEDFLAMTGSKPRRRPQKRARTIQKKMDEIFPGLLLWHITLDAYKVDDFPEDGKRLPKKPRSS